MKKIKKTLIAGLLSCASFNTLAEVDPLSFGIKLGGNITPYVAYTNEAKIDNKKIQHNNVLDSLSIYGSLYGEYAFNDYIGLALGAGYLRQEFTLEAKENDINTSKATDEKCNIKESNKNCNGTTSTISTSSSIGMVSHGINIPLSLCVYPLGRDDEEGILKIMLGTSAYIPFSKATCKKNNIEVCNLQNSQKKEIAGFDLIGSAGAEYEFPFGLSIDAKYSFTFMNRFKLDSSNIQTIFSNTSDLKSVRPHYLAIGLGYNIASLLSQ